MRWNSEVRVAAPGRVTPAFARIVRGLVAPLVRLMHRPTLLGVENLPASGPYILVANHSGGMGIAEIATFMVLYLAHVGTERPLAGFTHPLSFRIFPLSLVLRHIGAIPSSYEAARETLAAGVPLLVFPGGDHETMRPLWQAFRVDFGGRRGFLRIARELSVPVVPLGIRGGHFTAPVLLRSRYVLPYLLVWPRLFGLKRWALTLFGVLGVGAIFAWLPWAWPFRLLLAWAWLASPFIFTSFVPWTIRMRIGEPIAPGELFTEDDASLDRALARVQGEVQRLVDR